MLRQRDKVLADSQDRNKIKLMRKFLLPSLMRDISCGTQTMKTRRSVNGRTVDARRNPG
jgi:hypothetical protein